MNRFEKFVEASDRNEHIWAQWGRRGRRERGVGDCIGGMEGRLAVYRFAGSVNEVGPLPNKCSRPGVDLEF